MATLQCPYWYGPVIRDFRGRSVLVLTWGFKGLNKLSIYIFDTHFLPLTKNNFVSFLLFFDVAYDSMQVLAG